MSRERELLARVLTSELWSVQEELQSEIKELLAQPEPLTPRQGLEEYKKGYAQAEQDLKREPIDAFKAVQEFEGDYIYKDGFIDGIKYAEKAHGIGE
jgi:hypothetical protein